MMGSVTLIRVFPYDDGNQESLRRRVEERVRQDGYEDGHCYSGSWSSLTPGLHIHTEKTYESVEAAKAWMYENLEKFEPLVAVPARHIKSRLAETDSRLKELRAQLQQIVSQRLREPTRIVKAARQDPNGFKTCKSCRSRIRLAHVHATSCPACHQNLLVTEKDRRIAARLQAQEKKLQDQIQKRYEALLARSKRKGPPVEELVWVVGGNCPS